MIKMLVTDLDNTLLRNDKSISDFTVDTLKKCQAKGIKVAFATARSTQASLKFLERFTPDVFIGYGGAISFAVNENNKVISRYDIPANVSSEIINKCLQEPEIPYILATNESVAYTNKINPSDTDASHYKCVDFSLYKDLNYLKISLVYNKSGIVERIASEYPMLDLMHYSGENLCRFANKNAVKWSAVKAVAEYYLIDTISITAFGDDLNDFEMLKNCGNGVAVKNSLNEIKAIANYICETNDNDGVAKWLEQHAL